MSKRVNNKKGNRCRRRDQRQASSVRATSNPNKLGPRVAERELSASTLAWMRRTFGL